MIAAVGLGVAAKALVAAEALVVAAAVAAAAAANVADVLSVVALVTVVADAVATRMAHHSACAVDQRHTSCPG